MGATNYQEQAFYLEGATATPGSGVQYISLYPVSAILAVGSAAVPSLTFYGDSDTGLYRATSNTLGFTAAGTSLGTWTTNALTLAGSAPTLVLSDTGTSAKDLTLLVTGNVASFYESAGAAGDIISMDLATKFVGFGTSTPHEQVELTKNLRMIQTTATTGTGASPVGVVYMGGSPFIHAFDPPVNGGAVNPTGKNTFVGVDSGNLTMGSTATAAAEASYNTGVGNSVLYALTTGGSNCAFGYASLYTTTTGTNNSSFGTNCLLLNLTGSTNCGFGAYALATNSTGSGNIAIGYAAGRYETGSNTFYVNNQNRTNTAGDTGKSLMYGIMAAAASNQVLAINAKVMLNLSETYAAPTYDLSFSGTASKTIAMERNVTADTAGQTFTIKAGGATSGATDKAGGALVLSSGGSTGSGEAYIYFDTTTAGGAGTGDNTPSHKWFMAGDGMLAPYADNSYSIGHSSYRVNKIIVGTGTSVFGGPIDQTVANGQTTTISMATAESAAMSGATATLTSLIPSKSLVVGVTIHPTTTVTSGDGGTTYSVGDGTDVDRWGVNVAFANDVDIANFTITSPVYYAAATDVVLTCDGGKTFSGGTVRATVHYVKLTAPTS